jgi:hypothetical protein
MALNLAHTKPEIINPYPVPSGVAAFVEGQPLSGIFVDNVVNAKPFAAAADDFLGVAYTRSAPETRVTEVEEFYVTQEASQAVTLKGTPVAGTLGVFAVSVAGVQTALAAGDPAANNGEYSNSGTSLIVNLTGAGATADNLLRVTYKRDITVEEARMRYGDGLQGPAPLLHNSIVQAVSVIEKGRVATNMFDPSSDFSVIGTLYFGANGFSKTSTSSKDVTARVQLIRGPTVADPYLHLNLR